MARELKVYTSTVHGGPEIADALGVHEHSRQFTAFVAAFTASQARVLFGQTEVEWRRSGTVVKEHQSSWPTRSEATIPYPGQVFVSRYEGRTDDRIVAVGLGPSARKLTPGGESSLDLADRLLAQERAATAGRKAQKLAWKQEAMDRRERTAETRQAIRETLVRVAPVLEFLNISPQTVVEGSSGRRQGILLPAETVEEILRLASVGYEIEGA